MPTHKMLDVIASDFLHVFARTEYALKASGFNNGDGPAEANWGHFAREVEVFVAAPPNDEVRNAIDFILSDPPKKQFLVKGQLQWKAVEPSTNSKADKLFQYIRRVRNNLFHGGKFNGHWFAPERSEALMTTSLVVLRAAIEVNAKVSDAFHS